MNYGFNLLPWRETQRKQRYWIFIIMSGAALLLGIMLSTLWYVSVEDKTSVAATAQHTLKQQLLLLRQTEQQEEKMQQKIIAMEELENVMKQIAATEGRNIEFLQVLSQNISPFVYLNLLNKSADLITITGKTISLREFAMFIQKLAKIKYLEPPLLQEIRNNNVNNLQDNFFTLQIKIKGNY